MINFIPNRQAICETLLAEAQKDPSIIVLCSDSRGSASLAPFSDTLKSQYVEVGIAEQNLVSISAGLASCGKKPFCASPACFLTTRSLEQIKVDVAYSNTNVKLIGISGGISYGGLGMSHHSTQDIAMVGSIPNMRVYLPSDRFQTGWLISELLKDNSPAYIRVGRNPVADIYNEQSEFNLNKAPVHLFGNYPPEITLIACGETVKPALDAAFELSKRSLSVSVLDMYCVKPLDSATILAHAENSRAVITIEEHVKFGGLGSAVSQLLSEKMPRPVLNIALPDEPVVAGSSNHIFATYGLDSKGIYKQVKEFSKS